MTQHFDAFISYNHDVSLDLARGLQKCLQLFAKPWYRRRAMNVFRDETNLAAAPTLWSRITAALEGSAYFVLLASHDAAESKWVKREVRYWLGDRDSGDCDEATLDTPMNCAGTEPAAKLLIVLTDGVIAWSERTRDFDWSNTNALPACLSGTFKEEPQWLDLREVVREGDPTRSPSRSNAGFMRVVAQLSAPIRGIEDFNRLVDVDYRQHRRAIRTAWAAAAVLLLVGVTAIWQWQAAQTRQRLSEARKIASGLIQQHNLQGYSSPAALSQGLSAANALVGLGQPAEAHGLLMTIQSSAAHLKAVIETPGEWGDVIATPDGTQLLVGMRDGLLTRWDVETGQKNGSFKEESGIRHLQFVANDRLIVSRDGPISSLWDTRAWTRQRDFSAAARWAALSPDGQFLALGDENGANVWSVVSGKRQFSAGGFVSGLTFSPDSRVLVVNENFGDDMDYRLRFFSIPDAAKIVQKRETQCPTSYGTYNFGSAGGYVVTSCDYALSSSSDASCDFMICTLPSMDLRFKMPAQRRSELAISPDDRLLATEDVGVVEVWDAQQAKRLATFEHKQTMRQVLLGAGDHVGMVSADVVWIGSVANATDSMVIAAPGEAKLVAIGVNGRLVALANEKQQAIYLWETSTPAHFSFGGDVSRFVVAKNGRYLGAVGRQSRGSDVDLTVVWDIDTGAKVESYFSDDDENDESDPEAGQKRAELLLQQSLATTRAKPLEAVSQDGRAVARALAGSSG
jgi:WD40 repeat protein